MMSQVNIPLFRLLYTGTPALYDSAIERFSAPKPCNFLSNEMALLKNLSLEMKNSHFSVSVVKYSSYLIVCIVYLPRPKALFTRLIQGLI